MDTLRKAEKLFRRIGPLKVTDEEIMRLADVTADKVKIVRGHLMIRSFMLNYDSKP